MSLMRCSQGHQNPAGSRFCQRCGEKLAPPIESGVEWVGDRYRIKHPLGHGSFGRTYLAEDGNRFNELCVLKEFVPLVEGADALRKAQELFEREADVLYKLQHPQIPRFRELLRGRTADGRERLFLVQDYVDGKTYRALLNERRSQGRLFTEVEGVNLLRQLLPVLDYLHRNGVIHRDISPENIILDRNSQQPVLIDFGGVKQIEADVWRAVQAKLSNTPPTRIGKTGYAPEEQLRTGKAFPHSDLYALAATVLVLLTGKEPHEFLGDSAQPSTWQQTLHLSQPLASVLEQMLDRDPMCRYLSAQDVMQDLQGSSPLEKTAPAIASVPALAAPASAAPAVPGHHPAPPTILTPWSGKAGKALAAVMLATAVAVGGWWYREAWLPLVEPTQTRADQNQTIRSRARSLGVRFDVLTQLTNTTLKTRYPELSSSADAGSDEGRSRWNEVASEWLNVLENHLSPTARQRLGTYSGANQIKWQQAVEQLGMGTGSLYDLTNARFYSLFPNMTGQQFIQEPIGQVWLAIADDTLTALKSGEALERVTLGSTPLRLSGTLNAGSGKVYLVAVSGTPTLRVGLKAPPMTAFLSLHVPTPQGKKPYYLSDPSIAEWTGRVEQAGGHEVVVVSAANQPTAYVVEVAQE